MKQDNFENEIRIPVEDINECLSEHRPPRYAEKYRVAVADHNLAQQRVFIEDPVPTGRQILEASNLFPTEDYMLLMRQTSGMLEEINLSETIDVYQQGVEQFIAFESDRIFYFELNGRRMPWGTSQISENALRSIGNVQSDLALWLSHRNTEDQMLNEGDNVDLSEKGLEKIYSKPRPWKLNVHGVLITSDEPTILASEAMQLAGFDASEEWNLILKVKGEPKKPISINDVIDLSLPGVEKLRLMRKEIINGEKPINLCSDFALLGKDTAYLNALEILWETKVDGQRRWLILKDYPLPDGYNHKNVDIAVEIPLAYPDAALDMFYCNPPLQLGSGKTIDRTESKQVIDGKSYQRWSRHLSSATRWNPKYDSVITQMTVIEESLLREVGE